MECLAVSLVGYLTAFLQLWPSKMDIYCQMFNQGGEEMGEKVKITADWELMAYSHWEKKITETLRIPWIKMVFGN